MTWAALDRDGKIAAYKAAWRPGSSAQAIANRVGASRCAVIGIYQRNRLALTEYPLQTPTALYVFPMEKPSRAKSSISAIRSLFDKIGARRIPYEMLANEAGVHRNSIASWKRGRSSPRLSDFENVAQVLGYRLELVKND